MEPRVDALVDAYVDGLHGAIGRGEAATRASLPDLRLRLIHAIFTAAREHLVDGDLERALDPALDALHGLLGAVPEQKAAIYLELGALDTVAVYLRSDPAQQIAPAVRKIARNERLMEILWTIRGQGPTSKGALARRLQGRSDPGAPATESEQSMMSRYTRTLRSCGLTHEVRDGHKRMVHLARSGERLLSAVDKGALPGAVRPRGAPVHHITIAAELQDAIEQPNIRWDADDASRYQLYVGAMLVARDLLARRETWSHEDYLFAIMLGRFPLRDTPDTRDEALYRRLVQEWSSDDRTRLELIHILYRYQHADAREALAGPLLQVASKLTPGSNLALVWGPCALNVASRLDTHQKTVRSQLLDNLERLLADSQQPLAYALRALRAQRIGSPDASRALTRTLAAMPMGVDGPRTAHLANQPLIAAARFNTHWQAFSTQLDSFLLPRVRETFPEAWQQVFRGSADGLEAAQVLTQWVKTPGNEAPLVQLFRDSAQGAPDAQSLRTCAREVLEVARDVCQSVQFEADFFRQVVEQHTDAAQFWAGLAFEVSDSPDSDELARRMTNNQLGLGATLTAAVSAHLCQDD